jgi:hypothetical protein
MSATPQTSYVIEQRNRYMAFAYQFEPAGSSAVQYKAAEPIALKTALPTRLLAPSLR